MRAWFKRISPDRDKLLANRWMRPLAHRLAHPDIWRFNRHNVARGAALGLFAGFMFPVAQTIFAALLSTSVRGNLLVAAAATLITNPFTTPPILYGAFRTGSWLLAAAEVEVQSVADAHGWLDMITGASLPTAIGLALFATVSAAIGHVAVHLGWRLSTSRRWRRRHAR